MLTQSHYLCSQLFVVWHISLQQYMGEVVEVLLSKGKFVLLFPLPSTVLFVSKSEHRRVFGCIETEHKLVSVSENIDVLHYASCHILIALCKISRDLLVFFGHHSDIMFDVDVAWNATYDRVIPRVPAGWWMEVHLRPYNGFIFATVECNGC